MASSRGGGGKSPTPLCETYVKSQIDKHQWCSRCSVKDAALIGRDHILDVDESVLTTVDLKHLQGLLDQVTKVGCLSLRVVNLVADVSVADLEQVEDGEDLAVVGHEGLTDGVRAGHEGLQDLQGDRDDLNVTGVQGDYRHTQGLHMKTLLREVGLSCLLLMGMMSWGMTGRTLAPPFSSMSKTPWTARNL